MNELKEWFLLFLASLGLDFMGLKSGMVGGFFSLFYERKRSARQAIAAIFFGAVLAGYLGPLVTGFLGIEGNAYGGVFFLIGLFSMQIIPWAYELIEAAIRSRTNGGPNKNQKPSEK